jgi:predicted acyltransferase
MVQALTASQAPRSGCLRCTHAVTHPPNQPPPSLPAATRSVAIDVMRGMTLALMIVVNMSLSEQAAYAPLLHAVWHGLTLTDVVFPSFLFVVGASLSHTLPKLQAQGDGAVLRKVLTRTALIFLCGYLLYWFPFFEFNATGGLALRPLSGTRILGVLQRIALCFGLASLIVHFFKPRGALVFCVLALLFNAWALATFGDNTLPGNAALKLDLWLLGASHLYRGEGIPFDPEGVLGTLPATVNVLAGYFAGQVLRRKGAGYEAVALLLMAAAACVVAGLWWSSVLPLNKKLWTSSYVLCTVGIATAGLAVLVYATEMRRSRGWAYFFEVLGRNTLFIYLFSEVVSAIFWLTSVGNEPVFTWLHTVFFKPWAGDKPGGLLYALAFMGGCWLVAYAMDKKKIYIKL